MLILFCIIQLISIMVSLKKHRTNVSNPMELATVIQTPQKQPTASQKVA